ncbi:hypothetical protein BZG72_15805 [Salinivibrio sp. PR6]|nr:hypothetical protein BZG72_15805 [Salinivibrio sp. PR6]
MFIRFNQSTTGVSTIKISETEKQIWESVCDEDGESLNQTVAWLWKQQPEHVRDSGNFTQFVRDRFLDRVHRGSWYL